MPEQQPSTSPPEENSAAGKNSPPQRENMLLNLGFNLLLPILILNKGKKWFGSILEGYFENVAVGVLLIALAFPVGYFIYDYFKRSKYNFLSVLGLISVLLTGGIGIFEIPTRWFALKEAAIPTLLGIAVVLSLKTPWPLVRTLLLNPEIMDVPKIQAALRAHNAVDAFERLLVRCTCLLAASFLLSGVLNYALARWIVVSPSGTDAFNAEVGKMMLWSWPVIALPSMAVTFAALMLLARGIHQMTGLKLEEVIHGTADQDRQN